MATDPAFVSLGDVTPYLNRWVALVRGRVISVGVDRQQAYRAAKRIRPKDKPTLLFINAAGQPEPTDSSPAQAMIIEHTWIKQHKLLQATVSTLQALQVEAYLVGGAVRDFLLGRNQVYDLDFAVPGDGLAVARQVANALDAAFYALDAERGTGRVVCSLPSAVGPDKVYLDFATFRGKDLLADLTDRDFTINAMALSLADSVRLIDPTGGQSDLATGQIRATSEGVFRRDPLRIIRAVRQAAEFGFTIEPKTEQNLQQAASLLPLVSPERQRDELLKLLNTTASGRAVRMLQRLRVLPYLLPEVEAMVGVTQSPPHYLDVFQHTTAALDAWTEMPLPELSDALQTNVNSYLAWTLAGNLSYRQLMPLALLLHDTGKPATRTETALDNGVKVAFIGHEKESTNIARQVAHRLRLSNHAAEFVETVVALHMRPLLLAGVPNVSRRAIYRFFRDSGSATCQAGVAVALHAMVDHHATYRPGEGQVEGQRLREIIRQLVSAYFEAHNQVIEPPALFSGKDLIEQFGLAQGRQIGELLRELKEAQAIGQVVTQADAMTFVKSQIEFTRKQSSKL